MEASGYFQLLLLSTMKEAPNIHGTEGLMTPVWMRQQLEKLLSLTEI
jgi:hypothetical protein